MPKKNKHHKKTFSEICSQLASTSIGSDCTEDLEPKIIESVSDIKEPKIDAHLNPDNQYFRWVLLPEVLRDENDEIGFGKYKKQAEVFLKEIELPLYIKYANKTWREVSSMPHCGFYKKGSLSSKQKAKLNCSFKKYFHDEETIKSITDQLYHVHLRGKHRLYGYRHNSIFYIVLNDKNHNFDKLS